MQHPLKELEGRVPSLDGLRAVSILMVVVNHSMQSCGFVMPQWSPEWTWWLFNGQLGVRIFFVISGFIITLLLLKEESRFGRFSIKHFYIRRAWRILPVYFIFILVIFVIDRLVDLKINSNEFIAAVTFTTGWWPDSTWMLGHTWSLSVEEQFYLLWPLMLFTASGKVARYRLLGLGVIVFPILRILVYISPLSEQRPFLIVTQGDSILAGCALAILLFYEGQRVADLFKRYTFPVILICLGVILTVTGLQTKMMWGIFTVPLANLLESVAIAWLIGMAIFSRGWPYALLNNQSFVFVGTVSYSWYLWQQLFLFACDRYFQSGWFHFPVNIMLSFVVAVASYYLVERTSQRLRARSEGGHTR